ncbi:HET-domain-containing protein [Viridothelium virens]|uniref:HET-domain-containing protein n=1 Tax=Viridothelium virens TaxID=1048519 RepID=A0A6A6HAI3_VIRVR|nr:HET-domain-containing protein [Viridothelium virens]
MATSCNQDDENLCSACVQIDIASLFRQACAREDATHLGRLEDIMGRASYCAFCETIIASLSSPLPYQMTDATSLLRLLQNDGAGTDCWLYSYCIFEDSKASIYGQEKTCRLAISTLHPDKNFDRKHDPVRRSHSGNIQLSASSAASLSLSSRFHGRAIARRRVDLQQARKWLDICKTTHGSICEHPGFQDKMPFTMERPEDLTVINVHRMCLQTLPPNAHYVALSYCWMDKPVMVNTKSIRDALHTEEAFLKTSQISSTIQEAIECTKELGQDFLWVDAMCITQDDSIHKMQQINQMDRVYGNASLTIVAATPGKHAKERLPGFSSLGHFRNQYVKKVQGLELMIPFGCLEDLLFRTRWDARGWTFQEAYLSRRLLFFTECQAYFQCSCGVCCEDSVGEYHHPAAFVHHSINLWNPRTCYGADDHDNFGDLWLLFSRYSSESDAFRAYCNFISVYMRRQLSYPEDILDAVSGLLKVFERSMDTSFISGLPIRWFDHALLWELYDPASRRKSRTLGETEQRFPSWSWTGWSAGSEPPFWLDPDECGQAN